MILSKSPIISGMKGKFLTKKNNSMKKKLRKQEKYRMAIMKQNTEQRLRKEL
jgi:hypothetical protein